MYAINESNISFVTTAMPRPEIIQQTYSSFTKKMQGLDYSKVTLYINIDSFPDKKNDHKRQEVINIAKTFFGNVVPNLTDKPNFANAVKWCFSMPETYYVFNIEDDWELLCDFDISFFNQFFVADHVQQVTLRAWKHANNNFFLSPSLLRNSFCKTIVSQMNAHENPEVQIRSMNHGYNKSSFICFPFDKNSIVLKDLGRLWMRSSSYDRGNKTFTEWSVRQEGVGIQRLADQNAQIPNIFKQEAVSGKRLAWIKDFEKRKSIKYNRRKG